MQMRRLLRESCTGRACHAGAVGIAEASRADTWAAAVGRRGTAPYRGDLEGCKESRVEGKWVRTGRYWDL
jgi:hypothetical protein